MRFIVNEEKKIIFGWSPKCGCTHIKNMVHFLENKNLFGVHIRDHDNHELPEDIENYIIIIIIRNPYKRIISGLFDKYKTNGAQRGKWSISEPLSFSNFLNKLSEERYDLVDYAHFSLQLDERFRDDIFLNKKTIIYDIGNIDYEYIGSLYNKTIPPEVIQFRGDHINKNTEILNEYVFDKEIDEYSKYKIPIEYFYNDMLEEKMKKIYKKDFEFFESKGFYYSCKQTDDLIRDYSKSISKINTYNSSKYRNRRNMC